MKSWSCIEFVFIQLSLTGLPQPRTGRQFIAWGVSPRNPEPSNDDPEPPKGAAEGEAWRCLIATRRSSGSRSSVAPVGGSGPQSWWLPLDFTSPGADAARLGTSAAPRLANLAPGRFRRFRATKQQRNPPWNWNVQPQLFITSRGGLAVSRSTLQHATPALPEVTRLPQSSEPGIDKQDDDQHAGMLNRMCRMAWSLINWDSVIDPDLNSIRGSTNREEWAALLDTG